ncbi:hypothetical protein [Catenovulum maritimum]|uniref:hypothetical protein n=1 Tax=Catenovulum maritimum TaxID=1513271 RepID=UPI00122E9D9F|nr:hypothetical protein [Catenovulum maritimum]
MKSYAGQLELGARTAIDYYNVEVESLQLGSINENVTKYGLNLSSEFDSKKADIKATAAYSYITHSETDDAKEKFFNYNLSSELKIIGDSLKLLNSKSLSQRVSSSQQGVFSDEIVGSENLVDVNSTSSSLIYSIPNPRVIRLNANLSYKSTKADSLEDSATPQQSSALLNTDTSSFSLFVGSGSSPRAVNWGINMGSSTSERGESLNTYKTNFLSANLAVGFNPMLSWVSNASVNKNELDGGGFIGEQDLNFTQLGTGLEWSFIRDSSLSIFAKTSKSGEQERRNYIAGEFNWVLSKRTSLKLSVDRNQFGETYGFNFQLANRYIQSSANYREGIDINSNQSSAFSTELNDEVVRVNNGFFNLTYDNLRKVKISARVSYSKQESLEQTQSINSNRKTNGLSLSLQYQLSRKSSFNASFRQNDILYFIPEGSVLNVNERKDENQSLSFTLDTKLSRRLNSKVELSKRKRISNELNADTADNRINLSVSYQY